MRGDPDDVEETAAQPLRFLFTTTFYPPHSFGGDGISVQRMARAFAGRGHDVTVLYDQDAYLSLANEPQPASALPGADGVRVIGLRSRLGVLSSLLVHQTGHPVLHRAEIRKLVDELKPDIIWHNNPSLLGGPGILGLDAPLKIYEAHEHWLVCPMHVLWRHDERPCEARDCLRCVVSRRRPPQLWRYTGLVDRMIAGMDLVIAKSEFSRRKHRDYGLRQEMEVLPLFLPPLCTASRPGAGDPVHPGPYFLCVSRLERYKGVQDLLPAIRRHGRADLLIAGNGDHIDALRAEAADLPGVHFLGFVPPDELARYYAGAIASLAPSLCYETFGATLIESFRLGTPVLARRRGSFPEIIETAQGGLLFDTEDELVAAMAELQDHPERRAALSRAALAGFDRHWREDRVIARYFESFAAAARKKGASDLAARLDRAFRDATIAAH